MVSMRLSGMLGGRDGLEPARELGTLSGLLSLSPAALPLLCSLLFLLSDKLRMDKTGQLPAVVSVTGGWPAGRADAVVNSVGEWDCGGDRDPALPSLMALMLCVAAGGGGMELSAVDGDGGMDCG